MPLPPWRTPIFSRDLANTSQPFFWLTKIMMGGSKPWDSTSRSFFLHHTKKKRKSTQLVFTSDWTGIFKVRIRVRLTSSHPPTWAGLSAPLSREVCQQIRCTPPRGVGGSCGPVSPQMQASWPWTWPSAGKKFTNVSKWQKNPTRTHVCKVSAVSTHLSVFVFSWFKVHGHLLGVLSFVSVWFLICHWDVFQNLLDVGLEAHVDHTIGLVQDHVRAAAQDQVSVLQHIDQTSGSRDDNL